MDQGWHTSVLVAAIAAVMFFAGIGTTRLWDEDEPKNAVCGQEMFHHGDWIVPTYNGHLRTDKPILIYWGMIIAYHLFGVTELAARFPSVLAGVGSVLLTFHLGRLMFNARSGFLASCLFTSALMFAVLARGATPDSLLILCITASLTSFVAGVAAQRGGHFNGVAEDRSGIPTPISKLGLPPLACVGMYVAMGLAVLAKGPIGAVMPLGIIGSFLLFFDGVDPVPAGSTVLRRWTRYFTPYNVLRVVRTLRLGWGLPLVALVALPWYIAVSVKTEGQWITGFVGTHNVGRFLHPLENHGGSPLYYVIAIFAGFFPGSVFLPVALWSLITSVRNEPARRPTAALLLCWIGCYVSFFTFAATKLPNYVVPCYPALAIATGAWLSAAIERISARDWRLWAGYGTIAVVGFGIAIALTVMSKVFLNTDPSPALPGAVAMLGAIACLVLLRRGQVRASVSAFVITSFLFTATAMTYTAYRACPSQDGPLLADRLKEIVNSAPDRDLQIAACRYLPPSIVFYLGHPIPELNGPAQINSFFENGGDVLVIPRALYELDREDLPADLVVLAEQRRFLRHSDPTVLIGRSTNVARGDERDEQSR